MAVTPNLSLQLPAQGTTPWDTLVNGNSSIIDSVFSSGVTFPSLSLSGTLTRINNLATVAGGIPGIIAKADQTAVGANIAATSLFAVPAAGAGMYRVNVYTVVTQAATVSSTLPFGQIIFTDNDTNISNTATVTNTNTGNTVGSFGALFSGGGAQFIINVKASTTIQFQTTGYATNGATPMQYAIHIKLEFLGL